jgi:microcystin-dependent protein
VPSGWLLCDGSAVSRTTYAALFAAIGTTYGAGNGSTTFNVPDLRGRTPVGADPTGVNLPDNHPALGATGGAETQTLTPAESGQKAVSTNTGFSTGGGTTGGGTTGGGTTGGATASGTTGNFYYYAGAGSFNAIGFWQAAANWGLTSVPVSVTVPGLSIPGLSVPGLSVPALSIPALSITGATASSPISNLQPYAAVEYFIKT